MQHFSKLLELQVLRHLAPRLLITVSILMFPLKAILLSDHIGNHDLTFQEVKAIMSQLI